jgi:geranylgeranyl pyrophosphate synthase
MLQNGHFYDEEKLMRLVASIRQSGAIDRAMDEARQYVNRGLEALSVMPGNRQQEALRDLALYVVQRHR